MASASLMRFLAHGEAYTRKGLIHRDISAGNILIYYELTRNEDGILEEVVKPLLADWELAKRVNEPDEKARQPDRTVRNILCLLRRFMLIGLHRGLGNSCQQVPSPNPQRGFSCKTTWSLSFT